MSLSLSFQTMEKQRICKICDKRFANGKAMGGHMRSHLAKLPIPPKPQQHQQENSPFTTDSTQPPPSPLDFHHRNNNNSMQSYRSLNQQELSDVMEANSDRESDTDSQPKNPTRRRSKRRRKTLVPPVLLEQHETLSSVSDSAFPEEDVAMCLLMLSRDKWSSAKGKEKVPQQQKVDETEVIYDDNDVEEDEDDYAPCKIRKRTQYQTKFRCETCKKDFQSYQALGGHRASHKKTKNDHQFNEDEDEDLEEEEGNFVVDQRVFECPFCNKVFESGQALGGHKKVHLSNLGNSNANVKSNPARFIDLNLPAPIDDDDEVVLSAVSNAE